MKKVLLLVVLSYTLCLKGFATTFWDCCKPSCSTYNFGNENLARQCDVNMNILKDYSAKSLCEGGSATTCIDHIPTVVNDTLAYAFGAVSVPRPCGKCFQLTFTGKGKYETTLNHENLKGKKLIVIASNFGYDVISEQIDILIPGSGVGIFNGCDNILGTDLGDRYGGFLSVCENEVGWSKTDEEIYEERKECLRKKCNAAFSGKSTFLKGCLFQADWMEAAKYPLFEYEEVDCPAELKAKY